MTLKQKIAHAKRERILAALDNQVDRKGGPFLDGVGFGYHLAIEELRIIDGPADWLKRRWEENELPLPTHTFGCGPEK